VNNASLKGLEQQVVVLAEQLGRIAGLAQGKAERWLDQPEGHSKLARLRRHATNVIGRLHMYDGSNGDDGAIGTTRGQARKQSMSKVAAPGKKHREAAKAVSQVKQSSEKIARTQTTRRRRTTRPRQR